MSAAASRLHILSRGECLELLAKAAIGRIAITDRALPVILPVNFAMDDGAVIFLSGRGSKLFAATRRAVVAFEIDGFDSVERRGWSVLVVGVARHVIEPAEVARLRLLNLRPYLDGPSQFVRIDTDRITGRQLS